MRTDIRKEWQKFKKDHPNFEKSKSFKSDVGPLLEKFQKSRDEFTKRKYQLIDTAKEVVAAGKAVAAPLKGYEAVVNQLKDSDKTIVKDFAALRFGSFESTYVDQYADAAKKIDAI